MKQLIPAAAFLCLSFCSFCQDTSALKEVIVSYQAGSRTPITFQNLQGKKLDIKNTGQEPSFLLSETPSITVYSDAGNMQGYSYYRLRGMDQTRINTTLDGMPLNEPEDQGAYFSNYPDLLNSISSIQIQRGVGTSKNGAASYAGSVQLFSPDLSDSAGIRLGVGYGSYNSFRAFGEYQTGLKNRKAFYVRASQIYTDGYKYHSSNNSQSVFASGGWYLDKSTWKFNLLAGNQRNQLAWLGVADSLVVKDRRTNANSNEKDHFFQALMQLQNRWKPSKRSEIQSSVYYTRLKGNYDFDLNNFIGLPSGEEMYNYAFLSNFTGLYINYTFRLDKLSWTTGLHGNLYSRRHLGSERSYGELYRNKGFKKEASAFSKAEYYFHGFTLFGDLQLRSVSFDYEGSVPFEKMNWQFINPKAGISLAASGSIDLYYGVGRTGREPTRNDIFGGNDNLPADSNGRPLLFNLDPESVIDHEAGIRVHTKDLSLQLNGYYMKFRNEIVLNGKLGPNGLVLTDKVARSVRTGLECSFNYRVSNSLSVINNASYNYSQIRQQSITFRPLLTPQWIINQELSWNKGKYGAALSGRYQSSSFIDFSNSAVVKDYVLVNARMHYLWSLLPALKIYPIGLYFYHR
ncbi:MAG: TonB-dependent receptor [Chitinophagaceae bacterium]|nr:TonB-dependent receptor [Chitinophagaceae bacterium]